MSFLAYWISCTAVLGFNFALVGLLSGINVLDCLKAAAVAAFILSVIFWIGDKIHHFFTGE